MTFNKSIQTKWKTQAIEATGKTLIALFIFGAVVGAAAPFYHIFYPKTAQEKLDLEESYEKGSITEADYRVEKARLKEKYRYFGFTNKRRFLFSIGMPVSLFFCSFILIYISKFVVHRQVRAGAMISGITFHFTALYFIIWNLWALKKGSDFPEWAYYTTIVLVSAAMVAANTNLLLFIARNREKLLENIKDLVGFILRATPKERENEMFDVLEKVTDE